MTYQHFQFESFKICLAFGHKDMRNDNSDFLVRFFTTEMLEAAVNNKIEFQTAAERWAPWFITICKKELDNRLDGVIFG